MCACVCVYVCMHVSAADPHAGNILFCLSTKHAPKPFTHQPHTNTHLVSDRDVKGFTSPSASGGASGGASGRGGRGRAGSDAGSDVGSVSSLGTSVHNVSNPSMLDLLPPTESGAKSKAKLNPRHIYDATPGKVMLNPSTGNPGIAAENDSSHANQRRMVYDATPAAKGVGFSMDISAYSADIYSPSAASSQNGTPISTSGGAGHTPFFPAPRRGFQTPVGSRGKNLPMTPSYASLPDLHAHTQSHTQQYFQGNYQEPLQLIPGLLDFGMTVRYVQ